MFFLFAADRHTITVTALCPTCHDIIILYLVFEDSTPATLDDDPEDHKEDDPGNCDDAIDDHLRSVYCVPSPAKPINVRERIPAMNNVSAVPFTIPGT